MSFESFMWTTLTLGILGGVVGSLLLDFLKRNAKAYREYLARQDEEFKKVHGKGDDPTEELALSDI